MKITKMDHFEKLRYILNSLFSIQIIFIIRVVIKKRKGDFMGKIIEKIEISTETLAILPAKEIEFQSYVLENNTTYNIKKTHLQLIKQACINTDWSTFDGRREAVTYHTGFKQKLPIPISIKHNIYAFPTHAINSHDCAWIFPHHILKINKYGTNQ